LLQSFQILTLLAGSIDKSDFPRFAHRGHPCALICRPGECSCWKPPPSALFSLSHPFSAPTPFAWNLCLIQFVSLRSPHFPFQPSTSPDQWIVRFQLPAHTLLADTPVTSESAPPRSPRPLPPSVPWLLEAKRTASPALARIFFFLSNFTNRRHGTSLHLLMHSQPRDCIPSPLGPSWIFCLLMSPKPRGELSSLLSLPLFL
jgi:hypothetical protein